MAMDEADKRRDLLERGERGDRNLNSHQMQALIEWETGHRTGVETVSLAPAQEDLSRQFGLDDDSRSAESPHTLLERLRSIVTRR
jgi:hypothetical protein